MILRTVLRLAAKDLYLLRLPLAIYLGAGVLAVVLAGIDDRAARSLGVTLAMNVFIAACFHLVLGNVLGERERKTLAFTLALPVSPRELVAGKLLSSVGMYVMSGLFATTALVFLSPVDVFATMASDGRGGLSHLAGWLAYFALTLGGFLALFSIVLATAIVSESLGWTITAATGLIFVVGNGLFLFGPRWTVLARYARELRTGGPALGWTLAVEALFITGILLLTFRLYERKTSYL